MRKGRGRKKQLSEKMSKDAVEEPSSQESQKSGASDLAADVKELGNNTVCMQTMQSFIKNLSR